MKNILVNLTSRGAKPLAADYAISGGEARAYRIAWAAVKRSYRKVDGFWMAREKVA
jgi:uncharacterized protein (DUF1810 family)